MAVSVRPPKSQDLKNANTVANWIEQQIPCFEPPKPVPPMYISAVITMLLRYSVTYEVIFDAIESLEEKGIQLTTRLVGAVKAPKNLVHKPEWRENKRSYKEVMEDNLSIYEMDFSFAVATKNQNEATRILALVIDILVNSGRTHESSERHRAENMGRIENIMTWAELREAPLLRFHLRGITNLELQELRNSPSRTAFRTKAQNLANRQVRTNFSRRRARRRGR